ncbi:MAG TPA: 5'-nucleotidase [Rectinemataceae bacterium]|nr:5'-nucleotidase [Rectinemataceae bacterium]
MSYPIESKIVIAVSSSALFDLTASDEIFRTRGDDEYREWMSARGDEPLERGNAFWFIRRFLSLNEGFAQGEGPVEVVLLSRNDPEAGVRVFKSIRHYGLDIVRAAFLDGRSPYPYISAFGASLFLSANPDDVRSAIEAGLPAGLIMSSGFGEDEGGELRVAFDFDGVIAGDEAERLYRSPGGHEAFADAELRNAANPLDPGPMKAFFEKLAALQKHQRSLGLGRGGDPGQSAGRGEARRTNVRTAIITARNAPAHERVINTLKSWGIFTDEIFFLGGIEKRRILEVFKPHLFFDDQLSHFEGAGPMAACVHVPFGIANRDAKAL